MFNAYPHSDIWINGRYVRLRNIVQGLEVGQTDFETNTYIFLKDWINGATEFSLHTSGSTGLPKTIKVTRSQMAISARQTAKALVLRSDYNALVCLDTKYVAGKMMIVRCLESAMKIFAVDPCANPLAKIPVDKVIHFAAMVPYQIATILESKHPHMLDCLLTCIIGGASIDANLKQKLQRFTTRIFATYGMTETVSHVALQRINGLEQSEFFSALPEIKLTIDDRGCLVIHASFLSGEIKTNDLVVITNENHFQWIGRWDNVINSGGVKVSPEIIEEKIGKIFTRLHIPNAYFIHGVPDDKLGQKVTLVLEGKQPEDQILKLVAEEMKHSFSNHEIPKLFFITDAFISTNTSKIHREKSFQSARQFYPSASLSTLF
jgi:O-succinylbenzoic acid--CoA ligase